MFQLIADFRQICAMIHIHRKKRFKIWVAKSGRQKNRVIDIQARLPLFFLSNNDPAFCNPHFGPFFKVQDPEKISGRPDKIEYWVQSDWAIRFLDNILQD